MSFLFDLFPVILFFAAFKYADIFVATAVAMGASSVQIAWVWLRHRQVKPLLWVNLVIIIVFGGMTLLLHDESFIKWKPTMLYWFFAGALAFSALVLKKNLMQSFMGSQINMPQRVWQTLNWAWCAFFALMGAANLLIAFALGLSTETWVNFKVFGGTGLMLLFAVAQAFWLSRYIEEKEEKPAEKRENGH